MSINPEIFRAYDIRGVVDETLTEGAVYDIGRAIGTKTADAGQDSVVIGRDGRTSGQRLSERLAAGIMAVGCDVIDIGMVSTPVLYFAAEHLQVKSAVMLTGSHNPANYNGLKIILDGVSIYGSTINELYELVLAGSFAQGAGTYKVKAIEEQYCNAVETNVHINRKLKVVIDCGNGAPGNIAPDLYTSLGCEVIPLYCEVDGTFPNHHPDPSDPKNLQELIRVVKEQNADLGFAFDGDGDRLGVVDNTGKIIWPDRYLMLFAEEILSRKPNSIIIYDVKCSRDVKNIIEHAGGKPIMWNTGHSLIKAKMRETNAELGAEMSGHIFFKDRWYGFDDALYTGARLLEILSKAELKSSEVFAQYPEQVSTPEISIKVSEENKFTIMEKLAANAKFEDPCEIVTIDGLRVEFEYGWGLIRPSNTTPKLVARFEAVDQDSLDKIKQQFKMALAHVAPDLITEL